MPRQIGHNKAFVRVTSVITKISVKANEQIMNRIL